VIKEVVTLEGPAGCMDEGLRLFNLLAVAKPCIKPLQQAPAGSRQQGPTRTLGEWFMVDSAEDVEREMENFLSDNYEPFAASDIAGDRLECTLSHFEYRNVVEKILNRQLLSARTDVDDPAVSALLRGCTNSPLHIWLDRADDYLRFREFMMQHVHADGTVYVFIPQMDMGKFLGKGHVKRLKLQAYSGTEISQPNSDVVQAPNSRKSQWFTVIKGTYCAVQTALKLCPKLNEYEKLNTTQFRELQKSEGLLARFNLPGRQQRPQQRPDFLQKRQPRCNTRH